VALRGFALLSLALIVLVLAFASPVPAADSVGVVVVDPGEFRQPIPDPGQGLTGKYDGQTVRFSGVARRFSIDKRTRQVSYEVQYDILQPAKPQPAPKVVPGSRPVPGKKPAMVVAETIVVAVSFRTDPRNLQKDVKASKGGVPLTVEGTGHIQPDGSLTITDAVVVTNRPFTER
jgi:hypothetical protein